MDFKEELKIIDKYVEIKEIEDGQPLIMKLILEHFLPNNRFEEARSWRNALEDKRLKSEAEKAIKERLKNGKIVSISRYPQNTDWTDVSPGGKAKQTDDQQYHYDRTISYMNLKEELIDDVEDIETCRNEWITFTARAYEGSLRETGALFETLAMAVSDYIELILLPDKFVKTRFNSNDNANTNATISVENAYAQRPEVVEYLRTRAPQVLGDTYLMNFFCLTGVTGKSEEVIVTDAYIAFIPEKLSGWNAGQMQLIRRESVVAIAVGSEHNTQYQGITSESASYWTLTFQTSTYEQFTRWLYLGKDEKEMNRYRPQLGKIMENLGNYFDLEEGDSFQTSDGYQTSFGYGFWV